MLNHRRPVRNGAWAKSALITNGRFSGATRRFTVGHVGPEAAHGRRIGCCVTETVTIDAVKTRAVGGFEPTMNMAQRRYRWAGPGEGYDPLGRLVEIRATGRRRVENRSHTSGAKHERHLWICRSVRAVLFAVALGGVAECAPIWSGVVPVRPQSGRAGGPVSARWRCWTVISGVSRAAEPSRQRTGDAGAGFAVLGCAVGERYRYHADAGRAG
jgi:hypothetical protein